RDVPQRPLHDSRQPRRTAGHELAVRLRFTRPANRPAARRRLLFRREDAQRRPPLPARHRLARPSSGVPRMKWETVIGLEVHTQLATQSKIFSGSSTAFGAAPNTQASAVDIALPGVLPVLNRGAVECAIKFGLAIGATLNRVN